MAGTYLELKDVSFSIGDVPILSGVSASFGEGRAACVMGSSGSGKSTMVKVAAGLVVPDAGQVLHRGEPIDRLKDEDFRRFVGSYGFAFQDAALWANQTLMENLCLVQEGSVPRLSRREMEERAQAAALEAGYDESLLVRPAQLSLGEQKLISVARALVRSPEAVIMDEPQASLDEVSRRRVVGIIRSLKERGKTLVIVTHDTSLAAAIADDLTIIHQGRVVATGPYGELMRSKDARIRAIMGTMRRESDGEGAEG